MKLLLALDNFSRGSGGAPASARELAQALLAAGHALHVLETGRPGRESWNGAVLERVRLHGPLLPADRDLRTLVLNPRWCRRVAERIAELRPDLVVTQGMLAPGAIAAARAAGLPAAYFFRGYAPLCPEQYVGLDPDQCRRPDCSRCLTLARRLKWPLVRGVLDLYDRTIPKADLIIANSRYIAGLLKRFWDVAAEVVYPTLDLPVASAPENSPGGYLLFVKPQAAKGLDVLVGLAAACPGRKFAVAGELGGSAARRLAALPNVQTLGWRTDMPAVYRGARAVLVPSL
jgi:glycosyltransferase involved in cell wall biosynthesis